MKEKEGCMGEWFPYGPSDYPVTWKKRQEPGQNDTTSISSSKEFKYNIFVYASTLFIPHTKHFGKSSSFTFFSFFSIPISAFLSTSPSNE